MSYSNEFNRHTRDGKEHDRRQLLGHKNLTDFITGWCIVRIWAPQSAESYRFRNIDIYKNMILGGHVGHVSLSMQNGTYISLWPKSKMSWTRVIFGRPVEAQLHQLHEDYLGESSRIPDMMVVLHTLDTDKIENEFSIASGEIQYSLKMRSAAYNCSQYAMKLLGTGSSHLTDLIPKIKRTFEEKGISGEGIWWCGSGYPPKLSPIEFDPDQNYTSCDVARLACKLKEEEIGFFKHIGYTSAEIAVLDKIDARFFLPQELNERYLTYDESNVDIPSNEQIDLHSRVRNLEQEVERLRQENIRLRQPAVNEPQAGGKSKGCTIL